MESLLRSPEQFGGIVVSQGEVTVAWMRVEALGLDRDERPTRCVGGESEKIW